MAVESYSFSNIFSIACSRFWKGQRWSVSWKITLSWRIICEMKIISDYNIGHVAGQWFQFAVFWRHQDLPSIGLYSYLNRCQELLKNNPAKSVLNSLVNLWRKAIFAFVPTIRTTIAEFYFCPSKQTEEWRDWHCLDLVSTKLYKIELIWSLPWNISEKFTWPDVFRFQLVEVRM